MKTVASLVVGLMLLAVSAFYGLAAAVSYTLPIALSLSAGAAAATCFVYAIRAPSKLAKGIGIVGLMICLVFLADGLMRARHLF